MKTRYALLTILVAAAPFASAEIYRCSGGGSVSYQQMPCNTATEGGLVPIATVYPDHTEARDRLAAREAAMDARLMKRLEIESIERIAREERAAREAELAAERERTAREAQTYPLWFGSLPNRGMRPYSRPRAANSSLR